jgi:hypothetical protein
VAGDGPGGVVIEAPHGVRIAEVLQRCGYDANLPVLIGGYHGTWLPVEEVKRRRLTRADLSDAGATLGAGVILPLDPSACPVLMTAQIVEYLAGQSAQRCGPCKFGLPALADAALMLATHGGRPARERMTEVTGLVTGRGACAHPDGTSRMVRSLLTAFPDEVALHERGLLRGGGGEAGVSEFDRLLADPSSEPLPAVAPGRVLEPDRIIQPGRIDSPDLPPRRYTGPFPRRCARPRPCRRRSAFPGGTWVRGCGSTGRPARHTGCARNWCPNGSGWTSGATRSSTRTPSRPSCSRPPARP